MITAGASGKLKLVGRAGTGVDNVDVPAATEHGVVVMKLVTKYCLYMGCGDVTISIISVVISSRRHVVGTESATEAQSQGWQGTLGASADSF